MRVLQIVLAAVVVAAGPNFAAAQGLLIISDGPSAPRPCTFPAPKAVECELFPSELIEAFITACESLGPPATPATTGTPVATPTPQPPSCLPSSTTEITLQAIDLPAGASFNDQTATGEVSSPFLWSPTLAQIGTHEIRFVAAAEETTAELDLTVNVLPPLTQTPTATSTATAPPTTTATATPTPDGVPTQGLTPTSTLSPPPSATPTPTPKVTASSAPTLTATSTSTATPSRTPTWSPRPSRTPTRTPSRVATFTPTTSATRTPPATLTPPATSPEAPSATPTAASATATASPAVTPTATAAPSLTPTTVISGDANCDGTVTAADIPALVELIAGGKLGQCRGGDTDGNGKAEETDLRAALAALFKPAAWR